VLFVFLNDFFRIIGAAAVYVNVLQIRVVLIQHRNCYNVLDFFRRFRETFGIWVSARLYLLQRFHHYVVDYRIYSAYRLLYNCFKL